VNYKTIAITGSITGRPLAKIVQSLLPLGPGVQQAIRKYEKITQECRKKVSVPLEYGRFFCTYIPYQPTSILLKCIEALSTYSVSRDVQGSLPDIENDLDLIAVFAKSYLDDGFISLPLKFALDVMISAEVLKTVNALRTPHKLKNMIISILEFFQCLVLDSWLFHKNQPDLLGFCLAMMHAEAGKTFLVNWLDNPSFSLPFPKEKVLELWDGAVSHNTPLRSTLLKSLYARASGSGDGEDIQLSRLYILLTLASDWMSLHTMNPYWLDAFQKHTAHPDNIESHVFSTGKSVISRAQIGSAFDFRLVVELITKTLYAANPVFSKYAKFYITDDNKIRILFHVDLSIYHLVGWALDPVSRTVVQTNKALVIVQAYFDKNGVVCVEAFNLYPVLASATL
jgi:hypothetical protein